MFEGIFGFIGLACGIYCLYGFFMLKYKKISTGRYFCRKAWMQENARILKDIAGKPRCRCSFWDS